MAYPPQGSAGVRPTWQDQLQGRSLMNMDRLRRPLTYQFCLERIWLTIQRALQEYQGVSSCLQHCLRSARYLPHSLSSLSPISLFQIPSFHPASWIISFSAVFLFPIRRHADASTLGLCALCVSSVSRVGIAGRSGVLQKTRMKNAPRPHRLYTDF